MLPSYSMRYLCYVAAADRDQDFVGLVPRRIVGHDGSSGYCVGLDCWASSVSGDLPEATIKGVASVRDPERVLERLATAWIHRGENPGALPADHVRAVRDSQIWDRIGYSGCTSRTLRKRIATELDCVQPSDTLSDVVSYCTTADQTMVAAENAAAKSRLVQLIATMLGDVGAELASGATVADCAVRCGCSSRTVERRIQFVREELAEQSAEILSEISA